MKGRDRPLETPRSPARTLTTVATCLLLAVALLALGQTPALSAVRGGLESAIQPVQTAFSNASYLVNSWIDTANEAHTQNAELQALREEIARLKTENARLSQLETENDNLKTILGFQKEHPDLQSLPSAVIGRDPSGLARTLLLDRGTRDGVRAGMAVTSPGGYLLGTVSKVTEKTATVLLVDDVDSSIPVVVDRTNVGGTLQGQAQRGGRLLMIHIAQGADVAKGDLIKTSGLGGALPRGLLIAQIYEMHQKDVDLEQQASAYALANLDSIGQVLVILNGGGTTGPRPALTPMPGTTGTPLPAIPAPLYPVPPTATLIPTRTPLPTLTPAPRISPTPTVTRTRTPVPKKKP
jgi:rod shape-determining protein MreC